MTVTGDRSYVLVERPGRVLMSQMLHHGQRVEFSGPVLHVRLGNGAAVLMRVNSAAPRVAGRQGQVVDFIIRPG